MEVRIRKEETTMATKKAMLVLFGVLMVSVWVLGSAIQAGAETLKYKVSNYQTQAEVIQVGDIEGHAIIIATRRGLAFFENGDVATYTNWATFDSVKGKTAMDAYTMLTFEDGSTIAYKAKGIWEAVPKGFPVGKGTGEFTKGTGKYEGIKGNLALSGKVYAPYSKEKGILADSVLEVTATYTLPQK
jgi:hypothetical protein